MKKSRKVTKLLAETETLLTDISNKSTWGGKRIAGPGKKIGNPGTQRKKPGDCKLAFSTRFDPAFLTRLRDYCRANGRKQAWILQQATMEYLDKIE